MSVMFLVNHQKLHQRSESTRILRILNDILSAEVQRTPFSNRAIFDYEFMYQTYIRRIYIVYKKICYAHQGCYITVFSSTFYAYESYICGALGVNASRFYVKSHAHEGASRSTFPPAL